MAEEQPEEITKEVFIEDVDQYMENKTSDAVLQELQEKLQRNRWLETKLAQRREFLKDKLPELKKALDIVNFLLLKEDSGSEFVADFELAAHTRAKAKLKDVHSVNVWLGAGVMVEYGLEDAKTLLETNLQNCKLNLKNNRGSLDFIKDNTTVLEVGIARVYNYDVERRKKERLEPST